LLKERGAERPRRASENVHVKRHNENIREDRRKPIRATLNRTVHQKKRKSSSSPVPSPAKAGESSRGKEGQRQKHSPYKTAARRRNSSLGGGGREEIFQEKQVLLLWRICVRENCSTERSRLLLRERGWSHHAGAGSWNEERGVSGGGRCADLESREFFVVNDL